MARRIPGTAAKIVEVIGLALEHLRRALPALLVAGATAVASAAPGAAAATGSAARRAPVYVASEGCRGHVRAPTSIILACADANLYATAVHFASGGSARYGSLSADAAATIHENRCVPDCAAGTFLLAKGTLILRRIVRCADGRLYYSRAAYSFPGSRGVAYIEPFERCSVWPARAARRGRA